MIPTTDNICSLWQTAAAFADYPEPYLFATQNAEHPDVVVTATYVETGDSNNMNMAAFHLWSTGEAHEPEWVAVAQPAYHATLTDVEFESLGPGELARRFADGDERVMDVLIVHVVTLDMTWTRIYRQPLLEPLGDITVNSGSRVVDALGSMLVAMHRPLGRGDGASPE
jgi:hypothetical protein